MQYGNLSHKKQGPGWINELGSWIISNNSYKPITNTSWVRAQLCKLQKRSTRPTTASDRVCQLLAHDRWFSLGTPASSTTKTGRHDIAEIVLKVALNTKNQSISQKKRIQWFYNTILSYKCNHV